LYSEGTDQNIFSHYELSLETRVGEDSWQINEQNSNFHDG